MNTVAFISLIAALHAVESDCGKTSNNELQISSHAVIVDVNRALKNSGEKYRFRWEDRYDFAKSRSIAMIYLGYWGEVYHQKYGKQPTEEVYARIWNGGPFGYKKKSTLKYWYRVRKYLNNKNKGEK